MKRHTSIIQAGDANLPLVATSDRPTMRFTAERDRDLRAVARLLVKGSGEAMTPAELADRTVHHKAPGYYADYDYAVHVVPRVMRWPRSKAETYRYGKWLEIADRAQRALAEGKAPNLSAAIAYVLGMGCASRFFISVATARRILGI